MKKYFLIKILALISAIVFINCIILFMIFKNQIILMISGFILAILILMICPVCILDYQLAKDIKSKMSQEIEDQNRRKYEKALKQKKNKLEKEKKKLYSIIEKEYSIEIDQDTLENLKMLMNESNRIEINKIRKTIDIEKKLFYKKIFDWADAFAFTIDGDFLIINTNTISDFINYLGSTQKLEKIIFCQHCRELINKELSYCIYCGHKLNR